MFTSVAFQRQRSNLVLVCIVCIAGTVVLKKMWLHNCLVHALHLFHFQIRQVIWTDEGVNLEAEYEDFSTQLSFENELPQSTEDLPFSQTL